MGIKTKKNTERERNRGEEVQLKRRKRHSANKWMKKDIRNDDDVDGDGQ